MGANPQQTLQAFREAEAYPGPSLNLAYCHCIAHGIDMQRGMNQQDLAVACGYWPLFRYNPALREVGDNPFVLDSPRPTIKFGDYAYNETRYRALAQSRPEEAEILIAAAQAALDEKYRSYEEMAGWSASRFHPAGLRNSGIAARASERVEEDAVWSMISPGYVGDGGSQLWRRGHTAAGMVILSIWQPSDTSSWATSTKQSPSTRRDSYVLYLRAPVRCRDGNPSTGRSHLWLAGPAASAAKPMPDGRQPEPGGWNRIVIQVDELEVVVRRTLRERGTPFRNEIMAGPGGRQILCEDPSGNPIELFEAA